MIYILFNPLSDNGHGRKDAAGLKKLEGRKKFYDITKINVRKLYMRLSETDEIIICGGDGTINRFVNDIYDIQKKVKIQCFKSGCGNDFARDVAASFEGDFVLLNPFIKKLPKAFIKGKEYYFLNDIGFGLDGYCCEKGDELKAKSRKRINYSLIALQGLLYDYKNTNARIEVDGKVMYFSDCLMAPSMNGRYYGGGIKIAPEQMRNNPQGTVSLVVVHNVGKLRALSVFPKIYAGNHTKYKDIVTVMEGHHIKVEFDRPSPLQIDGETVSGVTEYEVFAG